jgi:hypothetical protein
MQDGRGKFQYEDEGHFLSSIYATQLFLKTVVGNLLTTGVVFNCVS